MRQKVIQLLDHENIPLAAGFTLLNLLVLDHNICNSEH